MHGHFFCNKLLLIAPRTSPSWVSNTNCGPRRTKQGPRSDFARGHGHWAEAIIKDWAMSPQRAHRAQHTTDIAALQGEVAQITDNTTEIAAQTQLIDTNRSALPSSFTHIYGGSYGV